MNFYQKRHQTNWELSLSFWGLNNLAWLFTLYLQATLEWLLLFECCLMFRWLAWKCWTHHIQVTRFMRGQCSAEVGQGWPIFKVMRLSFIWKALTAYFIDCLWDWWPWIVLCLCCTQKLCCHKTHFHLKHASDDFCRFYQAGWGGTFCTFPWESPFMTLIHWSLSFIVCKFRSNVCKSIGRIETVREQWGRWAWDC